MENKKCPTVSIGLNSEKFQVFPLRSETKQRSPLAPPFVRIVLGVLANALRPEKGNRGTQIKKKRK